jgi:transposase-like protein
MSYFKPQSCLLDNRDLQAPHTSTPRVITVDKNAAYPKAFKELKVERLMPEACELLQRKYLNNVVEQDHRVHQTARQARDGLLFVRDGMAHFARI